MKAIRALLDRLGRTRLRAVPVWYRGIHFASTLEADWAATFDALEISWSHEPMAVRLSDGQIYRCDFWLPGQRAWCEVKGPHDLRIDKPRRLWSDAGGDADDWKAPLVVVCREPIGFERADGSPMGIDTCRRCDRATIVDLDGPWQCRICGFWERRFGGTSNPPFIRLYQSAARGAA